MDACLLLLCLIFFSVLSQEIGWEERLWNDLFCIRWDIKPQLSQSISQFHLLANNRRAFGFHSLAVITSPTEGDGRLCFCQRRYV